MVSQVDPNRLLLVEDDPNDIELIQMSFAQSQFIGQIDVVTDGEQALNYLLGQDNTLPVHPLPKLVLLDLKLPRISGIQVLETLRNHPRTQNVVVVVMSSSGEGRDIEICYNLKVNSYIIKPLDFQQFVDVSRQVGFYWMTLNQTPQFV
jgi:two-component system, response regulator